MAEREKSPLKQLAEAVFLQYGFSDEGVECLDKKLEENPNLFRDYRRDCAYDLLREVSRQARKVVNDGGDFSPKTYSGELQARVQQACGRFYNYLLPNGIRLPEALKEDLLDAAQKFYKWAEGNAFNARFLELTAKKLHAGQKVREVLNEEQLDEIQERAHKKGVKVS